MIDSGIQVTLRHADRICYAMQQAAIPWLTGLELVATGTEPSRDLRVTVELVPGGAVPIERRCAELLPGASLAIERPEPPLDRELLANQLERERATLLVEVYRGEDCVAGLARDVDLLAYNEWPGLAVLPALLASFVSPNHPALVPLLHAVADRLEASTGRRSLDGYQSRDPARARALVEAVYGAVAAAAITYVQPPPSFEAHGQKVRTPEQVLGDRLGTCLDLALLQAALLEHVGLQPFVVLQRDHAFVGAWLVDAALPHAELAAAVELRKHCDLGAAVVVETTLACAGAAADCATASERARRQLDDDARFVVAIDVAAARRLGVRPLPIRTQAFTAVPGEAAAPVPTDPGPASESTAAPEPSGALPAEPPPPAAPRPKDRLEHWRSKLLDLSMWNRQLNFVESKKVVPLCAHDLGALEDRLQNGARLRVLGKPQLGEHGDPRDLELERQRTGQDLLAQYLDTELRAGRLRSPLADDELEQRLVEVYRHARSTLEESGANTLYLALGFLRWYETPQSDKLRRAPLLLLPLVAERSTVRDGVRFVLDDAEPRLNQTLLQLLRTQFRVEVELGELLPEDEHGIDVAHVLDAFRRAVLGMPRWEVELGACIGFFSFHKHLMWLDLAARDELLQSPVLRHLIETPGQPFAQAVDAPAAETLDRLDPRDVLCPKDADSSQLAAVLAGARGRTFVLEGPPGTGKSQTITNLIVQALADDQRVLFVAEKRAALEVVQRRLEEVGIAPFALELHSSKSGPRAVLDQLKRTLEFARRSEPAAWQQVADELATQRGKLNEFVGKLHQPREHGFSLYFALGRLVALREVPSLPWPALAVDDAEAVRRGRAALAQVANAASPLGVPSAAPWWGVGNGDWLPATNRRVEPLLAPFAAAGERLAAAVAAFAAATGLAELLGTNPSRDVVAAVGELAAALLDPRLPPPELLRTADWRASAEALRDAVQLGRRRLELWRQLAPRWHERLLELDLTDLSVQFLRGADSFVLWRWWRLREPRRALAAVAKAASLGEPRAVLADLETAREVVELDRKIAAHAPAGALLGPAWQAGRADWAQVLDWLDQVDTLREVARRLAGATPTPKPEVLAALAEAVARQQAGDPGLAAAIAALRQAEPEFRSALQRLDQELQLRHDDAFVAPAAPGWFAAIAARVARWRGALPALREHCAYVRAAAAADAAGAAPFVAAHARGELAAADLEAAFERAHLQAWLDALHADDHDLARFSGRDHERAIAAFGELDRRAMQLAAEVVAARLAARLPQLRGTPIASSELGLLERELKKQRRHKPVRRLLAELPGLLPRLAPCLLMSPHSVVQFLGRNAGTFDLVVFDEASQMPVWDAAPALGRGKAAIVVGDSRQLPPTSFFQRQEQGDEVAADELPEDLESVLDECAAAGLPRMHLAWHYRSRHESLIAFSNQHYYDNRLLTFPAPADVAPGRGVRLVRVDGIYDRGGSGTNRREAEALVAEVVARLGDAGQAQRSLGIVTFSQSQQRLVEDLLDKARRDQPALEPHFTRQHEPVFVKNLENVQGDERDVILFSICYGPDQQGRYHENYGPINARGGERRLNVAITRARHELVVFASMGSEHVANRSAALGARHLRAFLDYAARGASALAGQSAPTGAGVASPFEAAVLAALQARGHEVHTQVGCSGYRIDLAVVDPRAPGRYLLGIECDGASYHHAATARDRDRLRAAVLRGLGWRLCRVWSTDFWQDAAAELARLDGEIAAALAEPLAPVQPVRLAAAAPAASDAGAPPAAEAAVDTAPAEAAPAADDAFAAAAETQPAPPAEPASAPEAATDAGAAPAAPPTAAEASPALVDEHGPRPYQEPDLGHIASSEAFLLPRHSAAVAQAIAVLVQVEAPVAFDRLARRVAAAFGIERVTERVRDRIRDLLPPGRIDADAVVWAATDQPGRLVGFRVPGDGDTGQRRAEELPLLEVGNAMRWLLRQHGALSRDDLAREAARQFGIARLGSVVRAVMAEALQRLAADGEVLVTDELVRLA